MSRSERLGVLGGTFDPPHIGHLVAAVNAFHALSLDRVLLVVSNIPWQKVGSRPITPAAQRLELVEAAVAGRPGLEASDIEIRLGGESSSVATLEHLHRCRPGRELFLVVGADAAAGLGTWRRAERLPELATLVVVDRPRPASGPGPEAGAVAGQLTTAEGGAPARWPGRLERVQVPGLDVSSTEIRRRVAAGEPVDFLVPDGVAQLLAQRLLYRGGR